MPALTRVTSTSGLLAAALISSLHAQESTVPGPSFKDLMDLHDIGGAVIAPSGDAVAYTDRTTDWDENGYDTEIWLVRPGEEPFQLTYTANGSSSSPAWAPTGRWLAFAADRGDGRQIYLIDPRGGEAWALTKEEDGVGGFQWSPDGSRIAFTRSEPEDDRDKAREKAYGAFAVEDNEYKLRHLWMVTLPDTPEAVEAERLTESEEFTVTGFSWSPDGNSIALGHRPDPLINSWMKADISVLDVESGEIRTLVDAPGSQSNPTWSPDGQWIAYQASAADIESAYYLNGLFFKVPADGGTPVQLMSDLDEDPYIADWTPSGIYLVAWQRTKLSVYRMDPNSGRTTAFATTPDQIWDIDFTPDGETMTLVGRTEQSLDEVYHSATDRFSPTKLTNMTQQIDGWELGTSEVVSWESRDGSVIEGVLHKPDDFDPSQRYPLFVVIHGGPTGIDYPTAVTG